MKQVWNVFVFLWYIYGSDKLLLTRAEVRTLDLSAGENSDITCGDHAVIRIDNVTVHAHESYCATNMSDACVLSGDDLTSIENVCNDNHTCTVDYPKKTSCLKQDRYFNLSYSCLVPSNMLCTFEFSFCVWRNYDSQWIRYSPDTFNVHESDIPVKDHTTNSENGTYIYFKRHESYKTAKIISGSLTFEKEKCLVLWYIMDESSSLTISTAAGTLHKIGMTKDNLISSWENISIPLPTGTPSEITIEGMIGTGNGYIALDDVDIQGLHCNDSSILRCNFEVDWCNFKKHPTQLENQQWARIRALSGEFGRPSVDHTYRRGFYVYTTTNYQAISPRRVVIITLHIELEVRCLSLWYYTYGGALGHLNIYTMVEQKEELQYSLTNTRTELWSQFQANIYNATAIILEYNYTKTDQGGIALDDIYISPEICEDEKPFLHECKEKDDEMNILCPVSNVLKEEFAFDSNHTMSCTTTSEQIENNLQQIFRTCDKTEPCNFTPAELVNDDKCFNMSKQLQLTYSCINGTEPTTSKPNDVPTISTTHQTDMSSNSQEEMTTDNNNIDASSSISTEVQFTEQTGTSMFVTTEKRYISTFEHADVISPSNLSNSSSVIGIVIGVILLIVVLAVCLVIAVIYVRRSRYSEKKANSIVVEKKNHNDYTGHQNVAFSPEVNVTTQTDYCEIRTSKHNDQYHDISDTFRPLINTINDDEYSEIANVVNSPNSHSNTSTNYQHQYITLDPNATGFDRSIPQNNLHNESKNNQNPNEKTSFTGGDDYAILDPDDLNESTNNTPKVLPLSENYVVLDPNETGFNRKESMDTVCNYELATPINPTETSEDPYDVSKDKTYDTSSNSRHKEKDNHIYSHMVDNVYDTAGNQRKKEDNDGTYDHFFGQQSEDDYDISKPL